MAESFHPTTTLEFPTSGSSTCFWHSSPGRGRRAWQAWPIVIRRIFWSFGEHYRLLAALMLELKPQTVIEIGTFKGLSALAMLAYLPPGGQLTTFDLIPWEQIPGTFLRETDFASGNFTQALCDLKDPENCRMHASLIKNADVIFIDGPKDGVFEGKLLENFAAVGLRQHTVLVFDDIHIWNMLGVWLRIRHPKLDITTIGHYTGTGIVEWLPSAT